jgi:nifR3 family TIM-barrel protein
MTASLDALAIGGLALDTPFVLAPMAGITDRQFRRVLRGVGGVGLVTMEFVSADAAVRGERRALRTLAFDPAERPLSIQIYGSDAFTMAEAARIVEASGADACDINMGCPANKILKGCRGAALMGEPERARAIVRAVRAAIGIPLTVKFRLGLHDGACNHVEFGRMCQEEGADAVALHARTARQMFRGKADWNRIAELKDRLSIPVLGNGDVETARDAVRMLEETGCAGVLIGRASMKNPWIYRQATALLRRETMPTPSLEERKDLILAHFELVTREEDDRTTLHKMRTFTGWYTRGLPEGRRLAARIQDLESPEAFVDAIETFFDSARRAA